LVNTSPPTESSAEESLATAGSEAAPAKANVNKASEL
jgi:hypothetical protein